MICAQNGRIRKRGGRRGMEVVLFGGGQEKHRGIGGRRVVVQFLVGGEWQCRGVGNLVVIMSGISQ